MEIKQSWWFSATRLKKLIPLRWRRYDGKYRMRRARWLLLVALLGIVAFVGATYLKRKEAILADAPAAPPPLDSRLDSRSRGWLYTQNDGNKPKVIVRAANQRQIREPSVWELEGVELQLFRSGAAKYDLVKSAKAEFDLAAKTLYSDGEVDIVMAVPAEDEVPPGGRLLKIHTSGVHFASDTGRAVTDRAATFEFGQGSGSAVGAEYDPNLHELLLKSQVKLDWRGRTPDVMPLHVEGGEAIYREMESKVTLLQWTRLVRGTLQIDSGPSVVSLDKGIVKQAGTTAARGVMDDPGRRVDFAADNLTVDFGEAMTIETVHGTHNARLVSTADTTRTTVTGDRVDLAFQPSGHDSILTLAVAAGNSVAEAAPISRPGSDLPETRTLRSEVIRLGMRPGGKEIDRVETDGPGTLDFTPNRPEQPKRSLKGDRVWIAYGSSNHIQSFRSVNVTTRTDPPMNAARPSLPVITRSRDFVATFDPATHQLAHIEQETGFQYEEGERRARGNKATLDQASNKMILDGAARVWDPSGSATADRIDLDRTSGDYTATGHVATTREADKKASSSALLSNQEVTQARAQTMVSTNRGQHLHYEGNAVAWQGANRVEANQLDIDRSQRIMQAHGNVVSQLADRAGDSKSSDSSKTKEAKAKAGPPVFTVVRAQELHYAEETRLAQYRGGVTLTRPGLRQTSRDLDAYLNTAESDNSLDKAISNGAVTIVSTSLDPKEKRTRTGTGEHAEYYVAEQKVILEGGSPLLVDSKKGKTAGRQLTWWANNDRLLVDGEEKQPVVTTVRKK
jgi:lipopolysaccharide export system protein LptA